MELSKKTISIIEEQENLRTKVFKIANFLGRLSNKYNSSGDIQWNNDIVPLGKNRGQYGIVLSPDHKDVQIISYKYDYENNKFKNDVHYTLPSYLVDSDENTIKKYKEKMYNDFIKKISKQSKEKQQIVELKF